MINQQTLAFASANVSLRWQYFNYFAYHARVNRFAWSWHQSWKIGINNVYNDLNISSSGYIFERVHILICIACPVYLHWLTVKKIFLTEGQMLPIELILYWTRNTPLKFLLIKYWKVWLSKQFKAIITMYNNLIVKSFVVFSVNEGSVFQS